MLMCEKAMAIYARLQYLQCVNNGDTAVLLLAINIALQIKIQSATIFNIYK